MNVLVFARALALLLACAVASGADLELHTDKATALDVTLPGPPGALHTFVTLPGPNGGAFRDSNGAPVTASTTLPSNQLVYTPNGVDGIDVCVWKVTDPAAGQEEYSRLTIYRRSALQAQSSTISVPSAAPPAPAPLLLAAQNSWGSLQFSVTSLPSEGTLFTVGGQAIASVPATLAGDELLFVPAEGFGCGSTSFTFESSDHLSTSIGIITLEGFTTASQSLEVASGSFLSISLDAEGCDGFLYSIHSLPVGGYLSEDGQAIASVPHQLAGASVTFHADGTAGVSTFTFVALDNSATSPATPIAVTKYLPIEATSIAVEVLPEGSQVSLTSSNALHPPEFAILSLPSDATIHECPFTGPCTMVTAGPEVLITSLPLTLAKNRVFIRPTSSLLSSFSFEVSDGRSASTGLVDLSVAAA